MDRSLGSRLIKLVRGVLRRQWLQVGELALPEDLDLDIASPPGVTVRRASRGDLAALRPLIQGESPERRLAAGDVILVAEVDGRIAGCACLANRPLRLPHAGIQVNPRPAALYCYRGYVVPEYRGHGIFLALQQARLVTAKQLGARLLWHHVDLLNTRAVHVHRRFGWVPKEELFGLVLLDRYAVTLWRRRLDGSSARPRMPTAPRRIDGYGN